MSTPASVSSADPTSYSPELKLWRVRVFAATWLCYAGFYFCRKPFSIVKSTLKGELHFDATTLGNIGAVYLISYALGQFIARGDHGAGICGRHGNADIGGQRFGLHLRANAAR